MAQYIDKAAIVVELEKRIKVSQDYAKCNLTEKTRIGNHAQQLELNDILDFINSLEVKEVEEPSKDLEKEFDKCCENYIFDDECEVYTARKFFKLGFKAKGE